MHLLLHIYMCMCKLVLGGIPVHGIAWYDIDVAPVLIQNETAREVFLI